MLLPIGYFKIEIFRAFYQFGWEVSLIQYDMGKMKNMLKLTLKPSDWSVSGSLSLSVSGSLSLSFCYCLSLTQLFLLTLNHTTEF